MFSTAAIINPSGNQPHAHPITSSHWFFPHPVAWLLAGLLVVADMLLVSLLDLQVRGFHHLLNTDRLSYLVLLGIITLLLWRARPAAAQVLIQTVAFFIFFGLAARIFNHASTALGAPFIDDYLAHLDAMLGLGRPAYMAFLKFVNAHPVLVGALAGAYQLHNILFAVTIFFLAVSGRHARLQEFTLVFMTTVLATLIAGMLFPAAGAYFYYLPEKGAISSLPQGSGVYFVPYLLGMHSGMRTVIDLQHVPGLVCMPSYHTVMALMIPWALRRTVLFPLGLIYGGLTLLATPVLGGHYFVDMIGGALLFFCAIHLVRRWLGHDVRAANVPTEAAIEMQDTRMSRATG